MNTRIRVLYVGTESTGFEPEFLEQYSECMIVSTEPTASDGLARLRGEPIDCVVSAYDLPHSTGIRLLEQIRDIDPDLPFVTPREFGVRAGRR
jgi:DNA-binding NarL/FixJ family response regulator